MGVENRMSGQPVQGATHEIEDDLSDGGFANPPKSQAGDCNAKLNRRKELIDGVFELEDRTCARTPQRNQLLNASLADADQGELRSHEEAAGQNEKGHHDYAEEHPLKH